MTIRRRFAACPWAPHVLAVLAAAACAGEAAAQSSPYYIGAAQSITHDSNLLRLGDRQVVPAGFSRGDTVYTTSLLGGFDQMFGRQRAYANVSLRNNKYSENSSFDNQSYNARGGLNWSTVERLSGTVSASANRSLQRFNSYEVGFLTEKNLETVQQINATASLGLVTAYSFDLSGGRVHVRNSLQEATVQAREFEQDNVAAGLRWRASSGSSVGLSVGRTEGRYPKFRTLATGEYQADRFERDDVTLNLSYSASGASSVDLRVSQSDTKYDLNQARNFSGLTGSLTWNWQVTGKTKLTTVLSRDTGQESYSMPFLGAEVTSDYSRITNMARVLAQYRATGKISGTAAVAYFDRSAVRTIDSPLFPGSATGDDRITQLSLGVQWVPRRWLQLGCDVSSEKRRGSGDLVTNLSASSYGCYGQITLQ